MTTTTTASLRRQSFDRIPRFFFPKVEADDGVATRTRDLCRQRALEQIDELLLSQAELQRLTDAICQHAYAPKLTTFQRSVLKKTATVSDISVIDRMLRDNMVLLLSYDDWKSIQKIARSSKVEAMMTAQAFLMDEDGKVNGYALLEYVYELHRMLTATRSLLEQPEGTVDGHLSEGELSSILERLTASACKTTRQLKVEEDFYSYYELICTRRVVLRHDLKTVGHNYITVDDLVACPIFLEWFQLMDGHLHDLFVVETNWFHPVQVRNIHRQYLQLDRGKDGLISVDELMDYGKKRAFNPVELTPTHDLTRAFVVQVFHETKTFPPHGELDYKAYIDFTLLMADRKSLTSLRFFWNVLDFQKQGFLDAFTIDFFLRELVGKISEHQNDGIASNEAPSDAIARLRTQVFDLIAPREPLRITWRDLTTCKLGHLVVRMLTDYAAFRDYEACEGRFSAS